MDGNNTIPGQFDDAEESIPKSKIFWREAIDAVKKTERKQQTNMDNNQQIANTTCQLATNTTSQTMNSAYNIANKEKKEPPPPQDYAKIVKDHLKLIENHIPNNMMSNLLMSIDNKNQQTAKKTKGSNEDTTFKE